MCLNTSIPDWVQTRQVCPVLTHIEDIDDLRTLERGRNQWHDIVGGIDDRKRVDETNDEASLNIPRA